MSSVTVWNEFRHERENDEVAAIYPDGMHVVLAEALEDDHVVQTATLDEPEHGLTESVLADTDVLIWWGHRAHDEVADEIVDRVQERVLEGMGLLVLHSGHFSKVFKRLLGTSCNLQYREDGATERLWVTDPGHPIVADIDEYLELPRTEMYGEPFDIPEPDRLVLLSWFEGGEVFRSGCCYRRGNGRIFYFRPGHETYPIYKNEDVLQVIGNAVAWATPTGDGSGRHFGERTPATEDR